MPRDLLLLCGSGFSRKAGYPSVDCLTKIVRGRQGPSPEIAAVREAAWGLTTDFFGAYDPDHAVNYEDLAFVVRQIVDLERRELENPAVHALLSVLAERAGMPETEAARASCSLQKLIRADVCDWLLPPEGGGAAEYPQELLDALGEHLQAVVTLNHDLLLEQNIRRFHDRFCDGFASGAPALWDQAFDGERIPFVKLHGSVDWRGVYGPAERGQRVVTIATSRGERWDPSRVAKERDLTVQDPAIVVGSFNKALDYHVGPFGDLYWWMETFLRQSDRVVVVGYGFGDQAFNASLIRWMLRRSERRILVADLDPEAMLRRARSAVRHVLPLWKEEGRLFEQVGCASDLPKSTTLARFLGE